MRSVLQQHTNADLRPQLYRPCVAPVRSKRLCETLTLVPALRYLWMEQSINETFCYLLSTYSELWEIRTRVLPYSCCNFCLACPVGTPWGSADDLTEVRDIFLDPATTCHILPQHMTVLPGRVHLSTHGCNSVLSHLQNTHCTVKVWRRMGEWVYRSTFSWPLH
jgi:hypothetical protein